MSKQNDFDHDEYETHTGSPNNVALWFGLAAAVVLVFGLFAYYKNEFIGERKLVSSGVSSFRVVSIQPPTSFYVTLENIETGEVSKHYVSKHCNAWRRLELESEWRFPWYVHEYTVSKERDVRVDVSDLCLRLSKL